MEYTIISLGVAVLVCLISFVGFKLLRRKVDKGEACMLVGCFWLLIDLLLLIALLFALRYDFSFHQCPLTVHALQNLYIMTFVGGIGFLLCGMGLNSSYE